ncbi:MAG TPA: hypothetical protein ENJ48_00825 [Anaerolineae bacterium]|nr:hypothetical protein [Anaerolineae bacterium]
MAERKMRNLGIGIALGAAIGAALGTAFGNIGMGTSFGVAFGVAFGTAFGTTMGRVGIGTENKLSPQARRLVFLLLGLAVLAALLIIGYASFR